MVYYSPKLPIITAATILCFSHPAPAFPAQPTAAPKADPVTQCLDYAEELLSLKMETTKELTTQSEINAFAALHTKKCNAGGKQTAKQTISLKKEIRRAQETAPNFDLLEKSYAEASTLLCATLAGHVLRYDVEKKIVSTPEQERTFLDQANQLCSYKPGSIENVKGEIHYKMRLGNYLEQEANPAHVELIEHLLRIQAYKIAYPLCLTTAKEVYKGNPTRRSEAAESCFTFPVHTWNLMAETIPLAEWVLNKGPAKPATEPLPIASTREPR